MTGLEPLLLGSAAAGGTAATAGLFGMGGQFALGQALMTAGSLTGLAGNVMGARADASAAEYNAAVERMEGRAEEDRRRRMAARTAGQISAGRAKSGVTMEGTPLLVAAASAELAELDALNARWASQTTADLYSRRASASRRSIPFAVGSSLLTTGSRLYR